MNHILKFYLNYFICNVDRDDEHCTALMLASSKGHTSVMMALMENHSDLNAVDKGKVIKHPNLP